MDSEITCPGCGEVYNPLTQLTLFTWMLRHEEHYEEPE